MRLASLLVFFTAVACVPGQVQRAGDPSDLPDDTRANPHALADERWAVTLEEIGWEVVPPEPPDRAFRAQAQGWQRHKRGDWAASRQHFAEAVSIVAEYDLARFNLACADARLGDLEASLDGLSQVLTRDLPRFKRSVLEDQDLGDLRRSALGPELERRIALLEDVWARAMALGTPAVAWRERSATWASDAQHKQGQLVRPGVWVHSSRRFVPATGIVPDAFSGLVDVDKQQAFVVVATPTVDLPPVFEGAQVLVMPLSPTGEGPRKANLTLPNLATIEVHAVDGGVRVRGNTTRSHWRELRASGLVRSPTQGPPDRPVLRLTPDGSLLVGYHPAGWTHRGRTVRTPLGREILLQRGHATATHHTLVFNHDKSQMVMVGVRSRCTAEGSVLRHWIDRLDLATATAEPLANSDGAAAAVFGRDGALYLQIGTETVRYATPTATRYETLPEGVMLVPPMQKPTCL